jgi:hypothetical protein
MSFVNTAVSICLHDLKMRSGECKLFSSSTDVTHYFETGLAANRDHVYESNRPRRPHSEHKKTMSCYGDNPKKINVSIEADSTLGNNALAVLSQQRNFG